MKMLLYCTKQPPYLYQGFAKPMHTKDTTNPFNYKWHLLKRTKTSASLNGKIVAECDYEVEEIEYCEKGYHRTAKTTSYDLEINSCLNITQIKNYLGKKNGYAIHIKNLHIFDEPKELSDYYIKQCQFGKCSTCEYGKNNIICSTIDTPVEKAPQNMCYVFDGEEKKVLISIRPQWMRKILNGEKTIEIRKKVLKEMLK